MRSFSNYFPFLEVSLEGLLQEAIVELKTEEEKIKATWTIIDMLKDHSPFDYDHSIRVSLLCQEIAKFIDLDREIMFQSGLFHDVGKIAIPVQVLEAETWDNYCIEKIKEHVSKGYYIVFSLFRKFGKIVPAVVLRHHTFKGENSYPSQAEITDITGFVLQNYSEEQTVFIDHCARIVALADTFDSLHRRYDGKANRSGEKIHQLMLKENPDQIILVENLFDADIFKI